VKQLEQRVESLIDLITANNAGNTATTTDKAVQPRASEPAQVTPPQTETSPDTVDGTVPTLYPIGPSEAPTFQPYDPVAAGVIGEHHANDLLEEFRTHFVLNFPFVIIDDAAASTLRHKQPFLFHAIMAVTAYETPEIQCVLGDEFRRQIARTIEYSCKSLDILQGLLIYAAWYHTFYHPKTQQMAIIVQLCVALVQDFGFTSNRKEKAPLSSRLQFQGANSTRPEDVIAGKRAFLGTYFLAVT
jgi:hypothetical protein